MKIAVFDHTNGPLTRAIHALQQAGFREWEEVNKTNIEVLLKIRGLGQRGLGLVIQEMDRLGV